ncbi:MAG TPA: DUF4190 domain-containing protein, partial [Kofleriaceae bacterium]|nr:DUF4190 domain-containing protein [Kofleriaceae bacterium]
YGAPPPGYGAPGFAPGVMPPGYMACPHCRQPIIMGAQICPMCRAITSPDGIYHGPKMNAPGATAALVCGLVGLLFCQIVMGPLAIVKSNEAKRAMANDPTLGGAGMATAGMVLGIIDLVLFVIWIGVAVSRS